jgi:transposase
MRRCAHWVEGLSAAQIAERFCYTKASVQTLISQYRDADLSELFASSRPGPNRQPKDLEEIVAEL